MMLSKPKYLFVITITVMIFTTALAQQVIEPLAQINVEAQIYEVAWSPDGELLALATSQGVKIYTSTLNPVTEIRNEATIRSISWSANSEYLAITNLATIEIWQRDTEFALLNTLQGAGIQIDVDWSPDGLWLAAVEADGFLFPTLGSVSIWDTDSWMSQTTLPVRYIFGLGNGNSSSDLLTWSSDSNFFAGIGQEAVYEGDGDSQRIRAVSELEAFIVDAQTGQIVENIALEQAQAYSIAWHPLDDLIAVGGESSGSLYDTVSGNFVTRFVLGVDIRTLDWSPDGNRLIGDATVADIASESVIASFEIFDDISSVDWSPDGSKIAIATHDGEIRVEDGSFLLSTANPFTMTPVSTSNSTLTPLATVSLP